MRILMFSMEFADPIFSGNGVLARTYANELVKQNHIVDVVTSYPTSSSSSSSTTSTTMINGASSKVKTGWISTTASFVPTIPTERNNGVRSTAEKKPLYIAVPVPQAKWRKLDWNGPHDDYAQQCLAYFKQQQQQQLLQSNNSFASYMEHVFDHARRSASTYQNGKIKEEEEEEGMNQERHPIDVVFIVDWHGYVAYSALQSHYNTTSSLQPQQKQQQPRVIFLNFRVFANPILLPTTKSKEFSFYEKMEMAVMNSSHATVCLADTDKKMLLNMFSSATTYSSSSSIKKENESSVKVLNNLHNHHHPIFILPPPLQPNVLSKCSAAWHTLPISFDNSENVKKEDDDDDDASCGTFLLCSCVRLDPTKNALKFVEIVEELAKRNNGNSRDIEDDDVDSLCFSLVRSKKYPNARLIPFLCGAAANAAYADEVRKRIRQACMIDANNDNDENNKNENGVKGGTKQLNCIIREDFVTSDELLRYFQSSVLNVHPCEYDAFGMTVSESAACGVLSITHGERRRDGITDGRVSPLSVPYIFGGAVNGENLQKHQHEQNECWESAVGACGLFDYEKKEVILTNFRASAADIAEVMEPLLVALLERAVECAQSSNNQASSSSSSSSPDLDEWHK